VRHFEARHLIVVAIALASGALACSSSDEHSPPIGAPTGATGPVVVAEGGSGAFAGQGGGNNIGGLDQGVSGGSDFAGNGFGASGNNVGGNGTSSGGSDPFGTSAGTGATGNQFGTAGGSSFPVAGSSFGGSF
jgi:hypothetical protein